MKKKSKKIDEIKGLTEKTKPTPRQSIKAINRDELPPHLGEEWGFYWETFDEKQGLHRKCSFMRRDRKNDSKLRPLGWFVT